MLFIATCDNGYFYSIGCLFVVVVLVLLSMVYVVDIFICLLIMRWSIFIGNAFNNQEIIEVQPLQEVIPVATSSSFNVNVIVDTLFNFIYDFLLL